MHAVLLSEFVLFVHGRHSGLLFCKASRGSMCDLRKQNAVSVAGVQQYLVMPCPVHLSSC